MTPEEETMWQDFERRTLGWTGVVAWIKVHEEHGGTEGLVSGVVPFALQCKGCRAMFFPGVFREEPQG